jgi:hypothetical protein
MTMEYIFFALLGCAACVTIVFCYTPSRTHDESGRKLVSSRTRTRPWHHDEKYQNEQSSNGKGR